MREEYDIKTLNPRNNPYVNGTVSGLIDNSDKMINQIDELRKDLDDFRTDLYALFSDIPQIASDHKMTPEEYIEWVKKNNPEFDWGEDVGNEIID